MSAPEVNTPENVHGRIDNNFAFHPSTEETGPKHDEVRQILRTAAHDLVNIVPASRDQALMLTALEEAMHWGNAAIAKEQPVQ